MKTLYMKQKLFSLSGKFAVKDDREREVYFVEGSFLTIPKTFTIYNIAGEPVAVIKKKTFTFLPKFFVEIAGQEVMTIHKEFSFLKARYRIDAAGIEVHGNWWDMEFQVLQHGVVVGQVSKQWLSWGDSYQLQVFDEKMEAILLAIVVAIDCVKASQAAAAASSG